MQWNVHGNLGNSASISTPAAQAIARIVNYVQPDVLLINEVANGTPTVNTTALTQWVNANLPYMASATFYVAVSTEPSTNQRNAAISRYPILSPFTYPDIRDTLRGMFSVQLQLTGANRLQIFHVHLKCCSDGTSCQDKQDEADLFSGNMAGWASTNSIPYIFAGDLNESEDPRDTSLCTITTTYHPITTLLQVGGLVEYAPTTLSGQWITWSTGDPAPFNYIRFDYILAATNRLSPSSGYVFSTMDWAAHGLYTNASPQNLVNDSQTASDHYSVVVTYSFPTVDPDFTVTPTNAFVSTGNQGGPFSPSNQVYTINNTNVTTLTWGVGKNASWLDLSATSGTLAGGASTNITVSITNSAANALTGGSYSDTLTFSNASTGASLGRSVNLTVFLPGQLSVNPAGGFSSTGAVGGPFSPATQNYTLSNTGSSALNWSVNKSAAWLNLSSLSGSLAGGASTSVVASLNANALAAGSYSDTIGFTNATNGAGNTTRPVSLTVNNPAGQLFVSPSSGFSSAGPPGGPFSASSQNFTLSNIGVATLNWTASNTANWLTVSPTNGTLVVGASATVTVSVNTNASSLSAGSYSDTVSFTNATTGAGNTTRAAILNVSSFGFYDDFSTFASGNLVGQQGWTQALAPSTLPLQVSGGQVVLPYGQTVDNQDAYKNFTVTNSTVFYGLTLTVSNAVNSTAPIYITAMYTGNNAAGFANFRLTAKSGDSANTNFVLGARVTGQSGDPYTFGTTRLSYGTQYRVVVQALAGGTNVIVYVDPTSSDLGAQAQYLNNPVGGGTPPTSVGSIVISQFGNSTTPSDGESIGKVVVADNFATVYNDLLGTLPPVASFTGSPTSGTEPLSVTFTDTSTGAITNRTWDFGDSSTADITTNSVEHAYTAGSYSVTLIVSGPGGASTNTQPDYIVVTSAPVPQLAVTPASLEYGSVAIGQTNSQPFQVVNMGGGTLNWTASVSGPFAVSSGGPYNVAAGQTRVVTVSFIPMAAGIFSSDVIFASNGGDSTNAVTGAGAIVTGALFSASPTNGTAPLLVFFTDASTGTITNLLWTFGDGATSGGSSPMHTYTTAGVFSVSLTVFGTTGSDTLNRPDLITVTNVLPMAGFTASPTNGVAPLQVSFTDASTGTITNRLWDFGDGGSSTVSNPFHTYTNAGSYSVELTVFGPTGTDALARPDLIVVANAPNTADLEIIKLGLPSPVVVASNLTYTITVTNHGPDTATSITLTDALPVGVSFVSASDNCTSTTSLVVCDLGSLTIGEATNVTVVVVPTVEGPLTNIASVAAAEADPNPTNNSTTAVTQVLAVPPPPHDLTVVKLKAPKKIALSMTTTNKVGKFSVTIQNRGPQTETIPDLATLGELVAVEVETLGTNCASFVATLVAPKKPFPIYLAPNKKLTLRYVATFNCANDKAATTKIAAHNDFSTMASVDLSALGEVDTASSNDACPRPPNPAISDPGCGNKTATGTLGADVLTDVVVKQ